MDPAPPFAQGLTPARLQGKGLDLIFPREPWVTSSLTNPSAHAPTPGKGSGKMVLCKIPQMFSLCKGWLGPFSWQLFLAIFPQTFFSLKNAQKVLGLFFSFFFPWFLLFFFFQLSCAWNPVFSKCMAEQLSVTWRITNIISAHDFVYIVCGKMVELQRCLSDVRNTFLRNFVVETRPFWWNL